MPGDPLIMVAKNVKGDTSKKPSTFTKTQKNTHQNKQLKENFWSISDKMKSDRKHDYIKQNLKNYWRDESYYQSQRTFKETFTSSITK